VRDGGRGHQAPAVDSRCEFDLANLEPQPLTQLKPYAALTKARRPRDTCGGMKEVSRPRVIDGLHPNGSGGRKCATQPKILDRSAPTAQSAPAILRIGTKRFETRHPQAEERHPPGTAGNRAAASSAQWRLWQSSAIIARKREATLHASRCAMPAAECARKSPSARKPIPLREKRKRNPAVHRQYSQSKIRSEHK